MSLRKYGVMMGHRPARAGRYRNQDLYFSPESSVSTTVPAGLLACSAPGAFPFPLRGTVAFARSPGKCKTAECRMKKFKRGDHFCRSTWNLTLSPAGSLQQRGLLRICTGFPFKAGPEGRPPDTRGKGRKILSLVFLNKCRIE